MNDNEQMFNTIAVAVGYPHNELDRPKLIEFIAGRLTNIVKDAQSMAITNGQLYRPLTADYIVNWQVESAQLVSAMTQLLTITYQQESK